MAFGRGRQEKDGAFIASMLDTFKPKIGEAWWVHRLPEEKSKVFPPTDHRHHWAQGVISMVRDDAFEVTMLEQSAGTMGSGQ